MTSLTRKRQRNQNLMGLLFLSPAIVAFVAFILIPLILGIGLSLYKYNLITTPEFIGLTNYKKLFADNKFLSSMWNTFKFLFILVPIHCCLGMVLAFLVYKVKRFQFAYRTAIYFPTVVTTASVAIAWGYLFSTDTGAINYFVRLFGGENVPWLTNPTWAYVTIALFSFWKFIGTSFLFYFIGLQGIPKGYYEAAEIEGSGTFHTFLHITVPLLSPTTFFVIVNNVIGVFQIFAEPYFITNGGPGSSTKTIALEIYETAFQSMNIGKGCSMSVILFIILLIITLIQYKGQNRWVVYDYE